MKVFEEYIIPINETAKDYDEMFVGIIRRQPVLIRCKDCKYWMPRQICLAYDTPQNYCEKHMPDDDFYAEIWNGNDFCSRAERKEE